MSTRKSFIGAFVLALGALGIAPSEAAPVARLKADLGKLSARASEVVNLTVDRNTIEWAAQAMTAQGGNAAELRELMKELDGIYIHVLEFGKEKALTPEEMAEATAGILAQLDAGPWTSIVSVEERGKKRVEIVRVSLFDDGSPIPGGLAVLVAEDDEIVLVNLVGRVRLDQLSRLGAALGQPDIFGGLLPTTEAKKSSGAGAPVFFGPAGSQQKSTGSPAPLKKTE